MLRLDYQIKPSWAWKIGEEISKVTLSNDLSPHLDLNMELPQNLPNPFNTRARPQALLLDYRLEKLEKIPTV